VAAASTGQWTWHPQGVVDSRSCSALTMCRSLLFATLPDNPRGGQGPSGRRRWPLSLPPGTESPAWSLHSKADSKRRAAFSGRATVRGAGATLLPAVAIVRLRWAAVNGLVLVAVGTDLAGGIGPYRCDFESCRERQRFSAPLEHVAKS
jgi:hypothetical protein